jgi:hypothetical protein
MARDYAKEVNNRLRDAFRDVLFEAHTLVSAAIDTHALDLMGIFLRDKAVNMSLGLAISMDEAGRIEVDLSTGYVKERVKEKTSARVTPGQEKLPFVAKEAQPAEDEEQPNRGPSIVGSVKGEHSPFYAGQGGEWTDTENRLSRVKTMGVDSLRQVIALPGCQRSVVKAADARLRKLVKIAAKMEAAASRERILRAGPQPTVQNRCSTCGNWSVDDGGCVRADDVDCFKFSAWFAKEGAA